MAERARVAAAAAIGIWLGVTAQAFVVPVLSFRTVSETGLANVDGAFPAATEGEKTKRKASLRYAASELNRAFFSTYALVQLGVAGLAAASFVLAHRSGVGAGRAGALALGTACLLAALQGRLSSEIVELGRQLDHVPRDDPRWRNFGVLHAVYSGSEVVKALALVVAGALLPRSARTARTSAAPHAAP